MSTLDARINVALAYFTHQGWTHNQAAGIVANLQAESLVNPDQAQYGGGPGYGIGQWERPRQELFKSVYGKDIHGSTLEEQLAFVQWELTNTEKYAGNVLKKAVTASQAADTICRYYERPADIEGQAKVRCAIAEDIAKNYSEIAPPSPVDPPAPVSVAPPKKTLDTIAHSGIAAGAAGTVISDIASQFQSLTSASRYAFWVFLVLAAIGGSLKVYSILKKNN